MVVERRRAQLRVEPIGELGKVGDVVLAARLADDRGMQRGRAVEPIDAFEQRGRAGQGDRELRDVAGLLERVDGGVEHRERIVGVGVDETQARRVAGDEADEEVDAVLVHVVEAFAPQHERTVGVVVPCARRRPSSTRRR